MKKKHSNKQITVYDEISKYKIDDRYDTRHERFIHQFNMYINMEKTFWRKVTDLKVQSIRNKKEPY